MNNESKPKVSVIMPAFNAEVFIGRTIESVINQTFSNWELIVIDDCSTDKTRDVVHSWTEQDSRIQLKALNKNLGGPAGPRNVGVGMAHADFVAFLDADDIWHPSKLEIQMSVIEENKVNFVCSQLRDFTTEKSIQFHDVVDFKLELISFKQQALRARIPTSSVVVSRKLLQSHPFKEDINYKAVEDYHCWLRLLKSTSTCAKVCLPLLWYRKIDGQISGSKLNMMRKVFMVHREYPDRSLTYAILFTFTHVFGGFYSRHIKKVM